MASSSTKSKSIAQSESIQRVRYYQRILKEFGEEDEPTPISEDNQACMS